MTAEQTSPPGAETNSKGLSGKPLLQHSDIPLIVYATVFAALLLAWWLQTYSPDLALNMFSELLGAAFTLFIVDTLLVRSKTKRWKIVQEHVDYLIGRDINRLRDGIVSRVFSFRPELTPGSTEAEQFQEIRRQRARLLDELEQLDAGTLTEKISSSGFFIESNFDYFDEKAGDIWDILNMRYAEYLDPELVAILMELHTGLKDICAHIRQYRKAEAFPQQGAYYHSIGLKGLATSMQGVLARVNRLKEAGYSEAAAVFDHPPETAGA